MSNEPTYVKLALRIIFVFIPTIFCTVVCISSKFTHSLDKWIFPCGLYLAFIDLILLISVVLYAVGAYINTQEYW
nr:MAG TPA: hypothetical protein [Caudoviricetes sp.]